MKIGIRTLLLAAIALASCGGERPAPVLNAARGAPQFSTPPPSKDNDARAARGLQVSPVPIDTKNLSAEDRLKVGIGSYIVNGPGLCTGCHTSAAGFLSGGTPFPLGGGKVVFARNLTPDPATGLQLNEWQLLDTLRTGRDRHAPGDRMLVVMPWLYFRWMSEADMHAIYAYLRAIPPVRNAVPPDNKEGLPLPAALPFPDAYTDGAVDRALNYNGDYFAPLRGENIAPFAMPATVKGAALESYSTGSYIVNSMAQCSDCHTNPDRSPDQRKLNFGAWLTGGTVFDIQGPPRMIFRQVRSMSANLKGATHGFFNEPADSFERFQNLIRSGTHVDETPPRPLGFPMAVVAKDLSVLIDSDLRAVYDFVKAAPSITGAADVERQPYAVLCAVDTDCGGGGQTCSLATHECIGKACTSDADCGACQTCGGGTCKAPAPDSACVASGR